MNGSGAWSQTKRFLGKIDDRCSYNLARRASRYMWTRLIEKKKSRSLWDKTVRWKYHCNSSGYRSKISHLDSIAGGSVNSTIFHSLGHGDLSAYALHWKNRYLIGIWHVQRSTNDGLTNDRRWPSSLNQNRSSHRLISIRRTTMTAHRSFGARHS